ncbi:MAG: hypothetical protein WAV41_01670 [Microgenomates group bacterium]
MTGETWIKFYGDLVVAGFKGLFSGLWMFVADLSWWAKVMFGGAIIYLFFFAKKNK